VTGSGEQAVPPGADAELTRLIAIACSAGRGVLDDSHLRREHEEFMPSLIERKWWLISWARNRDAYVWRIGWNAAIDILRKDWRRRRFEHDQLSDSEFEDELEKVGRDQPNEGFSLVWLVVEEVLKHWYQEFPDGAAQRDRWEGYMRSRLPVDALRHRARKGIAWRRRRCDGWKPTDIVAELGVSGRDPGRKVQQWVLEEDERMRKGIAWRLRVQSRCTFQEIADELGLGAKSGRRLASGWIAEVTDRIRRELDDERPPTGDV